MDNADWDMSTHPKSILEMHSSLCRHMKSLATFRFDVFNDALTNFRQALQDHIGEGMEQCKTGELTGMHRFPLENVRILDQISANIKAKGGPSNMKLRDYLEHYVSSF